ncbi:MAG: DivIVA domain-containing protein [Aminivibrio sp.]|jgi:cell division initiation protein
MAPELLTAREIESKFFSRGMRGYSVNEVDEFLDRVAEDIQEYALRCVDLERSVARLEEQIKEYDNLKETLQETLLMAQKSAEAKEEAAAKQAESLISEARVKAEQIVQEAAAAREAERREVLRLKHIKQEFRAEFRALLSRFASLAEGDDEILSEGEGASL